MTAAQLARRLSLASYAVAGGIAFGVGQFPQSYWWASLALGLFFGALAPVLDES